MLDEIKTSVLPAGYAGGLMVELEEERRQEDSAAGMILARARSLAWQAVRHTPCDIVCADMCLNWIHLARIWASRREMEDLAAELTDVLERLGDSLPRLSTEKYQ